MVYGRITLPLILNSVLGPPAILECAGRDVRLTNGAQELSSLQGAGHLRCFQLYARKQLALTQATVRGRPNGGLTLLLLLSPRWEGSR